MAFVVVGVLGVLLLVVALVADGVLDGVFHVADMFSTGWLSAAAIGGFLTAFGLVGWAVDDVAGPFLGAVAGTAAGAAVGGLAGWAARSLDRGATDEVPRTADLVGRDATVLSPVSAAGYGVVVLRVGGQVTKLNARADTALPAGARVWVTEALSATAVRVQALDSLDGPTG